MLLSSNPDYDNIIFQFDSNLYDKIIIFIFSCFWPLPGERGLYIILQSIRSSCTGNSKNVSDTDDGLIFLERHSMSNPLERIGHVSVGSYLSDYVEGLLVVKLTFTNENNNRQSSFPNLPSTNSNPTPPSLRIKRPSIFLLNLIRLSGDQLADSYYNYYYHSVPAIRHIKIHLIIIDYTIRHYA